MSRTVIDIDRELLEEARTILGTHTIRETVNRSLGEVVRMAAATRDLDRLAGDLGDRVGDPASSARAWR